MLRIMAVSVGTDGVLISRAVIIVRWALVIDKGDGCRRSQFRATSNGIRHSPERNREQRKQSQESLA